MQLMSDFQNQHARQLSQDRSLFYFMRCFGTDKDTPSTGMLLLLLLLMMMIA